MRNFHLAIKNGLVCKAKDGTKQTLFFTKIGNGNDNSQYLIKSSFYDKNGYYMAGRSWNEIRDIEAFEKEVDGMIELQKKYDGKVAIAINL